jgi:hypothetical protein
MAKTTRKVDSTESRAGGVTLTAAAEAKLEGFAEDLGKLLSRAQTRAEGWLDQRKAIADHLVGVRDTAARLLAQLGITETPPLARRGRKPGSRNRKPVVVAPAIAERDRARPANRKRTMSPEARAKIAAAQRARWAKQKKAVKG